MVNAQEVRILLECILVLLASANKITGRYVFHSCLSVCLSLHRMGSHVTITHGAFKLTGHGTSVQGPLSPTPPRSTGTPPPVLTSGGY